jgi:hypothetical protein
LINYPKLGGAREIHQKQEKQEEKHKNNESTTQKDLLPDLAFLI